MYDRLGKFEGDVDNHRQFALRDLILVRKFISRVVMERIVLDEVPVNEGVGIVCNGLHVGVGERCKLRPMFSGRTSARSRKLAMIMFMAMTAGLAASSITRE